MKTVAALRQPPFSTLGRIASSAVRENAAYFMGEKVGAAGVESLRRLKS